MDFIFVFFLISLLIKKLLKLNADIKDNEMDTLISPQIATLHQQQKSLLNILTKYFILSFFMMI